jgi:hypothetical protein
MNRGANGADEVSNQVAMDGATDSAAPGVANGATYGALVAKVARGAFLLMLAAILVSWAINVGNSGPVDQQQKLPYDRMYS